VVAAQTAAVRAASTDGVNVSVHHLAAAPACSRLLIAHATGFHGRAYGAMARAFDGVLDVWALDHRGHGATPAPAGWRADWHGFADDATAAASAVAATDSEAAMFGFGHSLGGATLLLTAHRVPALFAGLVLFEPIVFPPEMVVQLHEGPLARGARRRRRQFDSYAAAAANFAAKPPMSAFDPESLDDYVSGGFRPVDPAVPDGAVTLCCEPDFEAETFLAGWRQDVWPLLSGITTPTVVVSGIDDGSPPARMAAAVAARLPDGSYAPHGELDHMGPFTHPAEVAGIVADAVARFALR
jgi:pimeloyl-ACP methyl ester carboxylesterase